ncbi:MAG: hypothetical protein G01um101431_517 [Parcubacteria group bacterium Gr01-1014_31]|nr:MAG: hypothetical protein G01um101431_517 [Parcubacteria group bacterium Gr01-1014_31]
MPQIFNVKIRTLSSARVTIAASLMFTVSATAMFLTWGMIAVIALQSINKNEGGQRAVEKIVCGEKKHLFLKPMQEFSESKKSALQKSMDEIGNQARVKKAIKMNINIDAEEKSFIQLKKDFNEYKNNFTELARQYPKEALNFIPSQEVYEEFLGATSGCLPEAIESGGGVEIFHGDDFKNAKSITEYYINTDSGEKYIAYFSHISEYLESGTRISFQGFKIGKELLVHTMEVLGRPGNPPVSGPQNTAVLLLNVTQTSDYFDDTYLEVRSTKEVAYETVFDYLRGFYTENSYGQMDVAGKQGVAGSQNDIYGPYTIEQPVSFFCSGTNIPCNPISDLPCTTLPNVPLCGDYFDDRETMKSALAAAQTVDFSQYERVVLVLPVGTISSMGSATIGRINVEVNGNLLPLSFAWIEGQTFFGITHEYGHNLGWSHANLWNCPLSEKNMDGCAWEYYDYYDIMGYPDISQSNAINKELFGWLPSQDTVHKIRRVPQEFETVHNKTYTLKPLGDPSGGIEALKIYRGQGLQFPYLYIEYRKPTGLDGELDTFLKQHKITSDVFQGATIHTTNPEGNPGGNDPFSSLLIDGMATENETYATKALPYGESFFDKESCINITAGSPNENGLPIIIDLGPRSDYERPVGTRINQVGFNSCVAEYEVTAEDESGISKVEFYIAPTTFAEPTFLSEDTSAPFTFSLNTIDYNQPYITARVYDNALQSCGGTANNFSQYNDFPIIAPCGNGMKLDILSPKMNEAVPSPVVFNIHAYSSSGISNFDIFDDNIRIARKTYDDQAPRETDFRFVIDGLEYGLHKGKILLTSADPSISPLVYPITYSVRASECSDGRDNDFDGYIDYVNNSPSRDNGCGNAGDDSEETPFLRSDVNDTGSVNITDAIIILQYLFLSNPETLFCEDAADVDDNGFVNVTDAIYLLRYLYKGDNPEPPAPFSSCGGDPILDNIGCRGFSSCRMP